MKEDSAFTHVLGLDALLQKQQMS